MWDLQPTALRGKGRWRGQSTVCCLWKWVKLVSACRLCQSWAFWCCEHRHRLWASCFPKQLASEAELLLQALLWNDTGTGFTWSGTSHWLGCYIDFLRPKNVWPNWNSSMSCKFSLMAVEERGRAVCSVQSLMQNPSALAFLLITEISL